jgi:CHASE3 domain sensor protein
MAGRSCKISWNSNSESMTIREALVNLVAKARQTREAQRLYYVARTSNFLAQAKKLETELDAMIEDYTERLKAQQPTQSSIDYEQGSKH